MRSKLPPSRLRSARKSRRRSVTSSNQLQVESLEARQLLAGDDVLIDPGPPALENGHISGFKWEDTNADGSWDDNEEGLGGVTIYFDANGNERFERDEPFSITSDDGSYSMELDAGMTGFIREVVPSGYVQTFPTASVFPIPDGPEGPNGEDGIPEDELFAHVEPPQIELPFQEPGDTYGFEVAIIIDPVCIRPFEIDVVSSDPSVRVENITGVQLNGCGGDISQFEVFVTPEEPGLDFELQFVEGDNVLGSIPVFTGDIRFENGHFVTIEPGSSYAGLDFGNAPIAVEGGSVDGRKWNDVNGNGRQDGNEPGLAGVIIYADLNNNGVFDRREPSTETSRDIPETDFDEAGLYNLGGLPDGEIAIREVVPRNYRQTFPGPAGVVDSSATSSMNPGIAIDMEVSGASFGNTEDGVQQSVIDVTVVWPDSCGELIEGDTAHTIVGNHIVVELAGHQVGDACAEVISPQTTSINVGSIEPGDYTVVAVLHEDLRDGQSDVPTLTTVGDVVLGTAGYHLVSIEDGSSTSEINFGNQSTLRPGSVSGIKWSDDNGNGQRDEGEVGLGGVTIYLDTNYNGQWDADEPFAVSQEENPDTRFEEAGRYTIENVEPGEYSVSEVVPEGYHQTFPSWDWLIDPQPIDPWLGGPEGHFFPGPFFPGPGNESHWIGVESGQAVDGIDFGNQRTEPGSISGTKWLDANGNSFRDEDESPLGGVTIYLDLNFDGSLSENEPTAVTGDDGGYTFDGLDPGTYWIAEVVPEGYQQTFPFVPDWQRELPVDGVIDEEPWIDLWWPEGLHVVHLGSGQALEGINFGNQLIEPGSISGIKWHDANGNSQRDEDEGGLGDVTIYLDLNYNGEMDEGEPSQSTNDDGSYRFDDVDPGSYSVREVVPDGYVQTFPNQFILWGQPFEDEFLPDPAFWRVPGPHVGEGHHVNVSSGSDVENIDFGNQEIVPGSISGTTWLDSNGDRTRSDDEPGLAGVTIYLDLNNNQELDEDEPAQETAEDGSYRFEDLDAGFYAIREVIPEGYEQTFPGINWPEILPWLQDEPIDFFPPEFLGQHSVFLFNGNDLSGLDFGNRPLPEPGIVEGTVWDDIDLDGQRSDDEPGLADIVVFADLNGNGYQDRSEPFTSTGDDGQYALSVEPGTHEIRQVIGRDRSQTSPAPTGTEIVGAEGELLPEGHALGFSIVGIESGPAQPGVGITIEVIWPDGCGAIDVDNSFGSVAGPDGDVIEFQIAGHQVGEFCTLALENQTFTLWVDEANPLSDRINLQGSLAETTRDGDFVVSAFVFADVVLNAVPGQIVEVAGGETTSNVDFGNSQEFLPPGQPNFADVDGNGEVNPSDIDLLAAAIRGAENANVEEHDLTGDGELNDEDLKYLVEDLMQSRFGDSDMNGRFDSSDLVKVFTLGHYEDDEPQNSRWESGDWNGDGEFDSSDLVLAFQNGNYELPVASQPITPNRADAAWSIRTAFDVDKKMRIR